MGLWRGERARVLIQAVGGGRLGFRFWQKNTTISCVLFQVDRLQRLQSVKNLFSVCIYMTASENSVVSVSVLAAAVKSIVLDHLAVLMGSCTFIVKFDDEFCREFICFVADSPESMLMSALRDGPTANRNSGSICVLKSALNLFLKYATARSLCLSAISATPSQAPQRTSHGHYVTLLYCHMVLSRQLGKLSPCCAQACALYANYICQLLNLDGWECACVLDGLNAMNFVLHSIGASAISQTKTKSFSKRVIDVPDAAKCTALQSSHAPVAIDTPTPTPTPFHTPTP